MYLHAAIVIVIQEHFVIIIVVCSGWEHGTSTSVQKPSPIYTCTMDHQYFVFM